MTDPEGSSTRVRSWAVAAGVAALLLYLPSLANGFAYDDRHIIVENAALHDLSNLPGLWKAPYWPEEGASFGLWRPVTTTALAISWAAGGGVPWVFHLVNVLLHAGVSVLVVFLLSGLLPVAAAGIAGLAFALHPVHVEAVANGVGMGELLAAAAGLGALYLAGWEADPPGPVRQGGVVGLFILAVLAKEGAMVMPALLVLLDLARGALRPADLPGYLRRRGGLLAALAVAASGVLLLRMQVLGAVAHPSPPLGASLLEEIPRTPTAAIVWAQVARLLSFPLTLSPDYTPGVIPVTTVWTPAGILGVGTVLGALVLALALWRRRDREPLRELGSALALAVPWMVISFLPVSNLLFVSGVMLAERNLYLPSVGAAAVVGAGLVTLGRAGQRRWAHLAALLLGIGWAARASTYIPAWKDDVAIFAHMFAAAPGSGRSLWVQGDLHVGAGRIPDAVDSYRKALTFLGSDYPFLAESGRRLVGAGRPELGRPFLLRAVQEDSTRHQAFQLLTVAAASQGDWEEVLRWGPATLARTPADRVALHLTSVAYGERGKWMDARRLREQVVLLPGAAWQDWYWLAEMRARTGDLGQASAAADSARTRAPGPEQRAAIDSMMAALGGG